MIFLQTWKSLQAFWAANQPGPQKSVAHAGMVVILDVTDTALLGLHCLVQGVTKTGPPVQKKCLLFRRLCVRHLRRANCVSAGYRN